MGKGRLAGFMRGLARLCAILTFARHGVFNLAAYPLGSSLLLEELWPCHGAGTPRLPLPCQSTDVPSLVEVRQPVPLLQTGLQQGTQAY